MTEEGNRYGLAWFVAGISVGALVGILYAPRSGRETREGIANGAREGSDYLRNRAQNAVDEMGNLVSKTKERIHDYAETGREAVGQGRERLEEFVDRGKSKITEQKDRVVAAVDAGRQAYNASS